MARCSSKPLAPLLLTLLLLSARLADARKGKGGGRAKAEGQRQRRKGKGRGGKTSLGGWSEALEPLHKTVCENGRPCRPGEGNLKGYKHWSQPYPPYEEVHGKGSALKKRATPPGWGKGEPFPASNYEALRAAAAGLRGPIVLVAADFDYRELAENWFRSARRAGMASVVVYALDAEACAYLVAAGVPAVNGTDNTRAWEATRLERHIQIALAERHMAAAALVDAGHDVLLTDASHVFLRDPSPRLAELPPSLDAAVGRGGCNGKGPAGCDMLWNFMLLRGSRAGRRQLLLQFVRTSVVSGLIDFYLRWWAGHHCIFMGYEKTFRGAGAQLEAPLTPRSNAAQPNATVAVTLRGRAWCPEGGCLTIGQLSWAAFPVGRRERTPSLPPLTSEFPDAVVGRSTRPNRDHRLRLDRYDEHDFDSLRDAMRADGLWLL